MLNLPAVLDFLLQSMFSLIDQGRDCGLNGLESEVIDQFVDATRDHLALVSQSHAQRAEHP